MAKKRIVSKPGLFGITYHYENGRYIGKTRPGLLGNRKIHYDADGRQMGTTRPGVLSDEVHYDAKNKRYITSYQGLTGKTHFLNGRPVGRTVNGLFDTSYSSIEKNDYDADISDEEILYGDDEITGLVEDKDSEEDDYTDGNGVVKKTGMKQIVKKAAGVLFAIETVLFLILTFVFAGQGMSVVPGVAACVIAALVAFWCLRPVNK